MMRRERTAGAQNDASAAQTLRLGPGGRRADGRGGGGYPRSLSASVWCRTFRRGDAAVDLGDRAAAAAPGSAGVPGAVLLERGLRPDPPYLRQIVFRLRARSR